MMQLVGFFLVHAADVTLPASAAGPDCRNMGDQETGCQTGRSPGLSLLPRGRDPETDTTIPATLRML